MSVTKWGKAGKTAASGQSPVSSAAVIEEPFVLHGILINHDQANDAIIELYDALTVTGTPVIKFDTSKTIPYHDLGNAQFIVGLSTKVTISGGAVTWAAVFEI